MRLSEQILALGRKILVGNGPEKDRLLDQVIAGIDMVHPDLVRKATLLGAPIIKFYTSEELAAELSERAVVMPESERRALVLALTDVFTGGDSG